MITTSFLIGGYCIFSYSQEEAIEYYLKLVKAKNEPITINLDERKDYRLSNDGSELKITI